jgi:D-serine deaminase-like pyridoxal phosphate-dependent protein
VRTAGVCCERVASGSTTSASGPPLPRFAAAVPGVTEVRPGTYVYNDSTQLALGVVEQGACAQSVLAMCIGRPTADRTVVDAGSKALPMEDPSGRARGWGTVIGHPGLIVERLFEEHAVIFGHTDIRVGNRVRIIPNHACTATCLHSHAIFVDGASVEGVVSITARNWRSPGSGGPMPTRG